MSVKLSCLGPIHAATPAELIAQRCSIARFSVAMFRCRHEQWERFLVVALPFIEQTRSNIAQKDMIDLIAVEGFVAPLSKDRHE
jgi:hypothetical protein